MIPTIDFSLRCEKPIGLPPMSGSEIDTLILEYSGKSIAYISFAGAGRAGYSAHAIASIEDGLQVEIRGNTLFASSENGWLRQLSFDFESNMLKVRWAGRDVDFGGPCTLRLAPFHFIRMPKRDR